ncbi:MAG TPA: sugar phosphate isomerase/epimerase [Acidobacteriaceae bacterium]|jgi:sugar phosphate isomerase/epimerase|nr:sugar phosphate isomerase/epimerase [Acidobacteriaceae bacterium]
MTEISRRDFVKGAAACAAMLEARSAFANPLGLPIGLQLYSVRDFLPKDYAGTLRQLSGMGYQEVEAAGFFNHSATDVKQAMGDAGLHCVSAHYALAQLQPQLDSIIQYGRDLGLSYIICSAPRMRDPSRAKGLGWVQSIEAMTLDDWKWNAEQFNTIGAKMQAAGIQFGYHNHFVEFHRKENGVRPYDVILENTDPKLVTMEMDVGWVVIGGAKPEEYLRKYPKRFTQLHVKEFKLENWKPGEEPISTEMNQGSLDYKSIFAAAKHASIRHIYVEQEAFPDMPAMQALQVDANWLKAFPA